MPGMVKGVGEGLSLKDRGIDTAERNGPWSSDHIQLYDIVWRLALNRKHSR